MIPRYSRPAMAGLFEPAAKLELWLDVELAVAEAMAELDLLPRQPIASLRRRAEAERRRLIDPARVEEIERTTRHDVIAFLTHVEAVVGEEARFLHLGMTSSDLLDTTLAIQLTQAADLLLGDVDGVLAALRERAFEHRDTVCIGRSHGVHAEPTTFGVKLAGHHAEFQRARRRLVAARAEIATCAVSGAVGTFANIDPRIEARVAARFGLVPEPLSTQVIPRDRHAAFVATLAVVGAGIERFAVEVRHLQRTEVGEVEEAFGKGQKGSSAMPHKRNPVLSENLTGLARLIRAQVAPSLENVALWHERDISHSAVERIALPEACILLDFALARMQGLVEGLVVFPERMRANLERTHGLVHSQRVLLALTAAGLPRQTAYEIVQGNAMRAWAEGRPLQELLAGDAVVGRHLDAAALARLFDLDYHTAQVGTIFARVFGAERADPSTES